MTIPPSLLNIQKWFGEIVARPLRELGDFQLPLYDSSTIEEIEQRMTPGPKLTAVQRIGIHNQQYWFRFYVLLQQSFPTLTRLFGYEGFNRLIAEPYLLRIPPRHWSLSLLGRKLPQWVADEYSDEDKPLIYQAALLDEAYERLFLARKMPRLVPKDFPEALEEVLYLQPYIACFEFSGNFFAFRKALLEKDPHYWEENDFPKIDGGKRYYVLYLSGNGLIDREVTQNAFELLKAFEKGSTVANACSSLEENRAFAAKTNISSWFHNWTKDGWLYLRK